MDAVRDELGRSPAIDTVVFALRGAAAYGAFERALGMGATRQAPIGGQP